MPADTALRDRRENVDLRRDAERSERQDREEAPDKHEEGIARRMRNSEHVRRRDVLAGVPHRGGGRERREIDREDRERGDRRGQIGRAIVEIGAFRRHKLGDGNARPPARAPARTSSARWNARSVEATSGVPREGELQRLHTNDTNRNESNPTRREVIYPFRAKGSRHGSLIRSSPFQSVQSVSKKKFMCVFGRYALARRTAARAGYNIFGYRLERI